MTVSYLRNIILVAVERINHFFICKFPFSLAYVSRHLFCGIIKVIWNGFVTFFLKDSGTHLCVIDDSNEHMLTVWDWQKKSRVAEIKVMEKSTSYNYRHTLTFIALLFQPFPITFPISSNFQWRSLMFLCLFSFYISYAFACVFIGFFTGQSKFVS